MQVGKEVTRPRRDVFVEKRPLRCVAGRRPKAPDDHTAHHLHQGCDVVFGFKDILGAADALCGHIVAQGGEGLFVQKAGQVIAGIWQQLAPTKTNEQRVEFGLHFLGRHGLGHARKPVDRLAQRAVIAGQAGIPDDFRAELWNAFIAPAGTDPAILERLNTEVNAILDDPEVQKKMLAMGWQAQGGTADDLARRIADDTSVWGNVIDRIEAQ